MSRWAAIEPTPPLPDWRPRRTLIDLYTEKDNTPWYWRIAATLSAFLIMIGFLIFPSAFKPNPSIDISSKTSTIIAIHLIFFGYILSGATAFISSSWIFQLDLLLIPCFTSCFLGLFNVLYNLCIHEHPERTSAAIVALAISAASTFIYAVAALCTFRNIYMVRARDAMHRPHSGYTADRMMPETEQQRQQLLRLLLQQEGAKHGSPDTNQSTFRVEIPKVDDRRSSRSTLGTFMNLPRVTRHAYERANPTYGRQDSNQPIALPMDSVEEEAPLHPGIAPLPSTAYVPIQRSYDDASIPGIVNTGSYSTQPAPTPMNLPQLQENGYPLEKPPLQPLNEQHPLERVENHYHIVEDHLPTMERLMAQHEQSRSASRASTQSRESRRLEIELADRGKDRRKGLRREDLDDVEIVPSIKRVETDGWVRQMMSSGR